MNEVIKQETAELITADKIKDYMNTFGIAGNLNDNEKKQFIEIATAYQLNPFKREIYCAPYMTSVKNDKGEWVKERKLSIITGYESYLKRAERSGMLSGWKVEIIGEGSNLKAQITIHRNNWKEPLIHDVLLTEYRQDNKMWKEKPMTMLKKVAMAQGFRLAFPDELGGMPYAAEELPDNMTIPEQPKIEPPAEKPKADVTPEALKNDKGEIELQPGKHDEAMKFLNEVKTEVMLNGFLRNRDKRTWKPEELKEQDIAIAAIRQQWKAEAAAKKNK